VLRDLARGARDEPDGVRDASSEEQCHPEAHDQGQPKDAEHDSAGGLERGNRFVLSFRGQVLFVFLDLLHHRIDAVGELVDLLSSQDRLLVLPLQDELQDALARRGELAERTIEVGKLLLRRRLIRQDAEVVDLFSGRRQELAR
jgi:hypothetical protein